MPTPSSFTLPLRTLLALTAVVLLAHLALLQGTPMTLGLDQPQPNLAFNTRTIEATPIARPPAQPPVTPAAQTTRPHPTPARQERSEPGETPHGPDTGAQPVATVPEPLPAETPALVPPSAPATEVAKLDPVPRDPALPVMAYTVPDSMRFKYKVETNKFPFSLHAELLWKQDGKTYDARLEISAFGQSRAQTSRGDIGPQGLLPIRFSDKFRSEVAAHFNREQGKVTFSANTPDAPLLPGAQDRLSVLIQLGTMIAGAPTHFPTATTIAIQTIGPRDADTWIFTVEGEDKIALPGGEFSTVKLIRNPRKEFDQKVELWLAPNLGYLPARLRITESNGDFIDQKLLTFEPQA